MIAVNKLLKILKWYTDQNEEGATDMHIISLRRISIKNLLFIFGKNQYKINI